MVETVIDALLTGRAAPLGSGGVLSGIAKQSRQGALKLGRNGLEGDEQGDRIYHGGPDKALHHYAADHYPAWAAWHPGSPVAMAPGAFGENISTTGITENDVHVGDVFSTGTVLLQVTQARQPCFRLNLRLQRDDAALWMQTSGRTGWYYRVLRAGWLGAGDTLALVDRPCPDWPLARVIAALFPLDVSDPGLPGEWRQAARLAELAPRWRDAFARRLATGRIEDWTLRLQGSADGGIIRPPVHTDPS